MGAHHKDWLVIILALVLGFLIGSLGRGWPLTILNTPVMPSSVISTEERQYNPYWRR